MANSVKNGIGYQLKEVTAFSKYAGRIIIKYARTGRTYINNAETYVPLLEIDTVLEEKYSGASFPGYENVSLSFNELETIVNTKRKDWYTALTNQKGVYVITDSFNGKLYIGSAYGTFMIWSRWEQYIQTGHGWDQKLVKLIKEKGLEYARTHFRFSILDTFNNLTDDSAIIERESYWKKVFNTRTHGYNAN